jgi:predicted dehydrogenase
MKKYKVAVVGCGGRSAAHIESHKNIKGSEVTACFDISAEKREAAAAKYGLKAYKSIDEMLRAEKPDIVHLVTGPETRVELMTKVSDAGVPLCAVEKPIAAGVDDWRALCKLEASSKTKFAVSHQVRWQKDLSKCREALASGKLGKILFLEMTAGMNLAGQGTHTLNYGRMMLGDPLVTSVFGQVSGWDETYAGHGAPLCSEAYLEFESGHRALWTSGPVSPFCGDPKVNWQHVRVAAYAERGRALYEEFGKWEIVSGAKTERGDYGGMDEWGKKNFAAQEGLSRAMINWLEGGDAPGTSLKASLHEWRVILALYQSSLDRKPVKLDGFEPGPGLVEKIKNN